MLFFSKNNNYSIIILTGLQLILSAVCFSQRKTEHIKLNQAGFYPGAPKLAIITDNFSSDNFYITSVTARDTFFAGILSG
jgi:endoglucanase